AVAWSLDPDVRRLRAALVWTVIAVCALALVQEVSGAPSGIWYHGRAFPRIAGPLEGPNQLAGYLGIAIPFLAVFCRERPLWPVFASALAATALVLTLSRAGLAAGAIALLVVLVLRRDALRPVLSAYVAGFAGAACVLLAWHVSDVGSRFVSFGEVE